MIYKIHGKDVEIDIKGSMSQIFLNGPSHCFMKFRAGIFLENILKYQIDHSDKFGGAI